MKLTDRAAAACRQELLNWARWSMDDPNNLGYKPPGTFKYYLSGRAFDEPEQVIEPIDEIRAEKTERAIMGLDNKMARRLLVYRYINRLNVTEISKRMRTSKPSIIALLKAAERLYWESR